MTQPPYARVLDHIYQFQQVSFTTDARSSLSFSLMAFRHSALENKATSDSRGSIRVVMFCIMTHTRVIATYQDVQTQKKAIITMIGNI